jgi:hypothetical protein
MQVADESDKQTQEDKPPELLQQGGGASRGVTVTLACLAALLIVGAAIANSLPDLDGFSLPSFDRFTLPKFDHFALPGFNRNPAPKSTHLAVTSPQEAPKPPRETVSIPIPDPAVTAALTDIQASQRQHTVVLASLTQDSATQRDDLKKISRQLSALAGQVESLAPPLTTSSIPRQPFTTSSIPRQHARARIIRTPRKTEPPLPPPVGPVSVGGAPLSPAPAPTPAPVTVSSAR